MIVARFGVRLRAGGVGRGAVAMLLVAAVGLGVLPFSAEMPPLLSADGSACRFEPIDVCGAGDASPGMLADTPALVAEALAVVIGQAAVPAPPEPSVVRREGFAPGVYRPPRRPSC
jgi:hypothetical protein